MSDKPTNPFELSPEDCVEGADQMGREDMMIPQLVLVQPQSKNVPEPMKHGGQFYNTVTGEFKNDVTAILLSEAKARVCFAREYDGESDPLCASDDSQAPRPEYIGVTVFDSELEINTIIPEACGDCPLSKFGPDGESPMCAKSYTFAMMDSENGIPFVIRAQRTASQAGKQLITLSKTLGRRKYIHIASRAVESPKGNYYVPVFAGDGIVDQPTKKYALTFSLGVGNIASRMALTEGGNGKVKQIAGATAPEEPPDVPF